MINLNDIQVDPTGNRPWRLSLSKLTGLEIADVQIMVSHEFGEAMIELLSVEMSDGTILDIGGEHDIAYFEAGKSNEYEVPNCDDETLESISRQVEETLKK